MTRLLIIFLISILAANSGLAKQHEIEFHVKYGFIKGGEVVMYINDTIFNGRPSVHYKIDGRTTGITNVLYGVHDIYETTVDAETYLPLKAIRNIHEGNYRRYNETLFYHDIDSLQSQRKGWREMPHNLLDIISGFFYFVNKNPFANLQEGDGVRYSIYHADKIMDVTIKYLREEVIKTHIGNINCLVLAPVIPKGKMFNRTDGIRIYLSKETKQLMYVELETVFGSIKGKLNSYKIDGVEQKIN